MASASSKAAALLLPLTLLACGGESPLDPDPVVGVSLCGDVTYPPQASSPYVLPWSPGETYLVGQGNCGSSERSHRLGSRAQFAYDVFMPIGARILAMRGGTVVFVEERFVDGTDVPGEENTVLLQHEDGSIGNYGHLTHEGVLVDVGDVVGRGELIGLSGDTGASSAPHLHFEVLDCPGRPWELVPPTLNPCRSRPITFRNTRPHPQGLVEGESYTAE